jgi:hypothetical protein
MRNPFSFGEAVSGSAFWNREAEIKELTQDLRNGQNVIMFSARRYGKTSLIKTVLHRLAEEGLITIYMDLYPATSKEAFVRLYAKAVSESLGKPSTKIFSSIRRLLPRFLPKLVVDSSGKVELTLDFDESRNFKEGFHELLESVHKRATREKKNAVVVFDEFQEVTSYGDDEIEREMRSAFQHHRNVSYVFLGSKKHLFQGIFNDVNRPFYRSGKHFPLGRLPEGEIVKYVTERFKKGKIILESDVAKLIATESMGHPYYTQLLCHILWSGWSSGKNISKEDVFSSIKTMLNRESPSYQATMDGLSSRMRQLAIALSKEATTSPYGEKFLSKHNLGTASTVQRALGALLQKDVIDHINGQYIFQDPFFAQWLQRFSR